MPSSQIPVLLLASFILTSLASSEVIWKPVADQMMTRWGAELTPENAWREYPRPQFERPDWQNLNGLWDYRITPKNATKPSSWEGKILVPFAIESTLSGVGKLLTPEQSLWYHRPISLTLKPNYRTLLHFEAADYQSTVWINDQQIGKNTGGNTPFSFDITDTAKNGLNDLVVRIDDVTGEFQLKGKQSLNPESIFYTRVSGIWQTVWLEHVPSRHIADIKLLTAINPASITITPRLSGASVEGDQVRVKAFFKGREVGAIQGSGNLTIKLENPQLWSPQSPNLYDLKLELIDQNGAVLDSVNSYAGVREIGQKRDAGGQLRFTLNGEEIFHWGPLDQGWWPDGLLTPPSDQAMRYDVDFIKQAGFNMIRKHMKIEPRRFYTYCDQVGILLWQDQVSGGPGPKWAKLDPTPSDAIWPEPHHRQWMEELKAMVDTLHNSPSIVVWTPFNEAWGQHRTMDIGKWLINYDASRKINIASGGNFWPAGHIADYHSYPFPYFPLEDIRFNDFIKVVGEFGGHGLPVKGHLWKTDSETFSYGDLSKDQKVFSECYTKSLDMLKALKEKGISAGVYTQTTDVEGEINGLLTYDRKVAKIPATRLAELHQSLGPEIRR
ncbi:MAG: glycoside hydrolase family 2 [Verrucomicrobia bacterium]|nr:MAG: glycoside hydrolase family 2 [Verrucomicrobiota bacterium]